MTMHHQSNCKVVLSRNQGIQVMMIFLEKEMRSKYIKHEIILDPFSFIDCEKNMGILLIYYQFETCLTTTCFKLLLITG